VNVEWGSVSIYCQEITPSNHGTLSPYHIVLANTKLRTKPAGYLPACVYIDLRKRYDGRRDIGNIFFRFANELLDRFIGFHANLGWLTLK